MSKEKYGVKECIEVIKANGVYNPNIQKYFDELEGILTEYEAIKNAEPSEALECLENFIEECKTEMYNYAELQNGYQYEKYQYRKEQLENIKQALIQAEKTKQEIQQELEQYYFKLIELLKEHNQDYYTLKETLETKSKKEQAFDVIKEKRVNVDDLLFCIKRYKGELTNTKQLKALVKYNTIAMCSEENKLTEEEFNTLKENLNENN